jgi:broad specificity phosphatase PhoE
MGNIPLKNLYNRVNRRELKARIQESTEPRVTLSYYKYVTLPNPLLEFANFANRWVAARHIYAGSNARGTLEGDAKTDGPHLGAQADKRQEFIRESAPVLQRLAADTRPIVVLTSQLCRSRDTGDSIVEVLRTLGLAPVARLEFSGLNDRFCGDLEGGPVGRWSEIQAQDLKNPFARWQNAESVAELRARVGGVFVEVEREFQGCLILAVSHADPIQVMGELASKRDLPHYSCMPVLANGEFREIRLGEADSLVKLG